MAVDSDGRIVVDGWVGEADGVYDTGVARYLSNGAPDHSFSGDGKTTVRLLQGSDDYAYGLALSGSKIIAGIHLENGSTNQIGLERFLSNGALDPSFGGGDGEVLTPTASPGMDLRDIAVDGNGRIVALAGTGLPAQLQLFRYLPSGNLDHGFGTAGASTASSLPSGVSVESMTIGPAGNIVGVGTSEGDVVAARWVG
jgi:uncharacterized delta-60 repeat protein